MNPYVSPKSDSTISAQSEQRTTLPTFLGKWIRILLACSTIASMIAAFITQITQGFGTSYGRAAITSQLAFGFVSLVTLAILQAIRAYRSSSADL